MRLGGEIKRGFKDPEEWIKLIKEMRYSCVTPPFDHTADENTKKIYVEAAKENDIIFGEVGVWRNTLSTNDEERKNALDYAKNQLALADEIGANCCVNIAGNVGKIWDGFSVENYLPETYDLIVESVRDIIDSVKPKRTFYSLEPMPWMVPDSPEQYLKLIKDVDRAQFGVHLDFVNMINDPKKYVLSDKFIKHCFELLGPHIKSIHGKDVLMTTDFTTQIKELMPGHGTLDYKKILPMVEALGEDIPFFVEHLPDWDSYKEAADFIHKTAAECGVKIK